MRETEFGMVKTEISAMIWFSLILTIFLKANNNLSRIKISKLINKTKSKKTITTKELLTICYLVQNYIKHHLVDSRSSKNENKEEKEVAFLVKYLLEQHKRQCHKIVCFCKRSRVKIDTTCWVFYREYYKGNFVFEALNLIHDLLKDALEDKT